MKKLLCHVSLWSLALAGICRASLAPAFTARERAQGYTDSIVLAKPRAAQAATIDAVEAAEGTTAVRHYPHLHGLRALSVRPGESVDRAIKRLRATGRYEYVERNLIRQARVTPNDPFYSEQWGLNAIGAPAAWDTITDASGVIVAVIDTGAWLTHSDLAGNLWTSATGSHGIDATVNSSSGGYNYPMDYDVDAHGTHVSGIIGAIGNNATDISGVAWKVKLMELKFLTATGGSIADELVCIQYAIDHGANIINASFGGGPYSASEFDAIKTARDAGVIVVVAAGNDSLNNDVVTDYPSGYALDNIVAVAATTQSDLPASYTNYGAGSVELGAPGGDGTNSGGILSLNNASNTATLYLSGTSMAAPHVTGALALLRAHFPGDSYRQLINRLLRSVTKLTGLDGQVQTGGRLNVAAALATASNAPFNDNFADRATLDGLSVHVRSNNAGASAESGEPAHAGVTAANSLWWTWTAPATTLVKISTTGSAYDTVLAVYTGDSLDTLQSVAANDDANGTTQSEVSFTAQAGTTYQIAVAGKGGASGYTALAVIAPPPNDDFSAATTVSGVSFSLNGSTLNASSEANEPNPTGQAAGNSVWYKWTAPASGSYSLSAFASLIDTVAAVYTGSSLGGLVTVASNDDGSTNPVNTDALVTFSATGGTTYYFQIDHNATYDGTNGGDFVLTLNDAAWEYPVGDQVTSSPAVGADGTIYFGAGSDNGWDRNVYAVNPDGSTKWTFSTSTAQGGTGVVGASPALGADGTVYVGGTDHILYALNGATGAKKWSATLSSAISSTPAVGPDGTIYVRSDTNLYAYSPTGALQWLYVITSANVGDGGTYASPALGSNGTVYIEGTLPNSTAIVIYAINSANGTLKWSYGPLDGEVYTSPAIGADGTIYFATLNGTVYALTDGGNQAALQWSHNYYNAQYTGSITSSFALGADGTLYFGGYDHNLHALGGNGTEQWNFPLGDEVRASSPAIGADGTIYIGCYDGLVYAVNPNGTLRRTYSSAQLVRSSPVIANNRLYFGSTDAKLYAFDIGESLAGTAWPMYHQNAAHTGAAPTPPAITTQPAAQSVAAAGSTVTLTIAVTGYPAPTIQWQLNGQAVAGATGASLPLTGIGPASTGIWTAVVSNGTTSVTSAPAVVGITAAGETAGSATLVASDIVHPNGNLYDQVLLTGPAGAITARSNHVTRISYLDLTDDIVQVEFAGHGTLSILLDNASGPAAPVNYNQPGVNYMKGQAHLVIAGADETTNVSVFTVGRATAFDPTGAYNFLLAPGAGNNPADNGSPLFQGHSGTSYDGIADLASLAILSTDAQFGGVRTADASYDGDQGYVGIYAPGVTLVGPVFLENLDAFDSATPVLLFGAVSDSRVTGGDLFQDGGAAVEVSGLTQLQFVAGLNSGGAALPAQDNRAVLEQNGTDVTSQIVVNPP